MALTFTVLLLTFIALTYGFLADPVPWKRIGGWLGILTAALAWYIMLAGILRSVSGGAIPTPPVPYQKVGGASGSLFMIVLASGGMLLAGEGSVPLYAACFAYFRMGLGSAPGSLLWRLPAVAQSGGAGSAR